jgi:phosphomannomutase
MIYIFDVDGTLTPSRDAMDVQFANWFEHFATHNAVYLASGSDRQKTLEQIPEHIYNLCIKVYQCSGNSVWEQSRNIYNSDWKLPEEPRLYLEAVLKHSDFSIKTGSHFDERPGLFNFSILGRNADKEQRAEYVFHDNVLNARRKISEDFNLHFSDKFGIMSQVAGETGIDITPVGKGKEQILDEFDPVTHITFFGDKTQMGGNDFEISQRVQLMENGKFYQVSDWMQTWEILKK